VIDTFLIMIANTVSSVYILIVTLLLVAVIACVVLAVLLYLVSRILWKRTRR